MMDKLLITNSIAQKKKYGAEGYREVRAAVRLLITRDAARGLKTVLIDVSDPTQMRKYGAVAVAKAESEAQNKDAVDRVYGAIRPHYLVLLDGPDVIPHILLNSLIPHDRDRSVPSDLPYASDRPFGRRDIAAYASVRRVVGRIPGLTGSNNPEFLVSQLTNAAMFKSRSREAYLSHFAISAAVFRKSTEQSTENIFRKALVRVSPATQSPNVRRMLAPLSHFINCHGGNKNPNFYGQGRSGLVVSMSSADLPRRVTPGTIVAAECCFGAQLFRPASETDLPMANAYLDAGAVAFFGSTNVAYGSPEGCGSADLIAQYFLIDVLHGASIGRACLQARQEFIRSQKMEDPVNLKTVAQFILLGDPSLQAVRDDALPEAISEHLDLREARRTRRVALAASGESAADCSGFPGRRIANRRTRLHALVRRIAVRRGFKASQTSVVGYEIAGRDNYGEEMKVRSVSQKVFVAMHDRAAARPLKGGLERSKILVAHAQNDRLVSVAEYISR